METILSILVSGVAFYIGGMILTGVKMNDFIQCIIVAIVVAILDFTLGNFLRIVTLGILSLGVFNWFLNAILILVADWFLKGFEVKNFWWALALAAVVSISGGIIGSIAM